jgi:hypothetical protein
MSSRTPDSCLDPADLFLLVLNRNTLDEMRRAIAEDWPDPEAYRLRETCWFGSVIGVPLRDPREPWQVGQIQGESARKATRRHQAPKSLDKAAPATGQEDRRRSPAVREDVQPILPDLPDTFDWTLQRPCPLDPPEQQGACAACVSFAVTAAVETTARIRTGRMDLPSLSEAEFFFGGDGLCWEGWNLDKAIERAREIGLVPRHLDPDPYDGFQQEPRTLPGPRTRVRSCRYIDIDDVEEAMRFLRDRGPLIHQSHVARDFFLYDSGIYRPRRDRNLLHCYLVVGYDRRRRAWKCRNHFSHRWGELGHFWLPFDWDFLGEDAEEDDVFVGIEDFASIAGL